MAPANVASTYNSKTADSILKRPVFAPRMSENARKILEIILGKILDGRKMGNVPLLDRFVDGYRATVYEDAVAGFVYKPLETKIKTILGHKFKDEDTRLNAMWLVPLFNREWDVEEMTDKCRFSHSVTQTEAYEWLTSKFIPVDFSYYELKKLYSIVSTYPLDDIKEVCASFDRPDQHSFAYLSKVLGYKKMENDSIMEKVEVITQASCQAIAEILKAQELVGKVKPNFSKDWLEDALATRKMYGDD